MMMLLIKQFVQNYSLTLPKYQTCTTLMFLFSLLPALPECNPWFFISMFYFILFNNFMGLFPYIFTSSSHLVFSLSMALPLWISFMIYEWFNNTMLMLAHSVPQGTPSILMPFMVCIETISNIIRPGTLAVRLSAYMIAGHLLMTLLGNTGALLNFLLTLLIMSQILLIILEEAVAMIQYYVFAILSSLYSSEVNNE